MLRNRLYYGLKPFLPFSLRLGIRRWFALRKRARVRNVWPIMPGSEKPPQGWPGWPDGKKFALVLTHDVEGKAGLDKCLKLAELEKSLGFRSSFTLIPRGEYQVTPQFREQLTREGFEIAVHDCYHDGKLFLTEKEFRRTAPEINRHLEAWGAVGFRSGFMLHNLDWLHDLNIEYDLSTFDTDPFEPQPNGRETIFPFWVPRPSGSSSSSSSPARRSFSEGGSPRRSFGEGGVSSSVQSPRSDPTLHAPRSTLHDPKDAPRSTLPLSNAGYVELPYTLPQDSTLFLLLRERHPDIWFQKLDWIAKNGGMALLNVHPDYMRFNGEPISGPSYAADLYLAFLQYARNRYADSFWQPLPKELAAFSRRALARKFEDRAHLAAKFNTVLGSSKPAIVS